jgi:hypothetical protein
MSKSGNGDNGIVNVPDSPDNEIIQAVKEFRNEISEIILESEDKLIDFMASIKEDYTYNNEQLLEEGESDILSDKDLPIMYSMSFYDGIFDKIKESFFKRCLRLREISKETFYNWLSTDQLNNQIIDIRISKKSVSNLFILLSINSMMEITKSFNDKDWEACKTFTSKNLSLRPFFGRIRSIDYKGYTFNKITIEVFNIYRVGLPNEKKLKIKKKLKSLVNKSQIVSDVKSVSSAWNVKAVEFVPRSKKLISSEYMKINCHPMITRSKVKDIGISTKD